MVVFLIFFKKINNVDVLTFMVTDLVHEYSLEYLASLSTSTENVLLVQSLESTYLHEPW